tara:strand:- start:455 stop:718 length:264 start_codon:yes stop_codon:yes gene_type:complete
MSPLGEFLVLVILFTVVIIFYTFKQFQESTESNSNYLKIKQMTKTKTKQIEKEKLVAETLNGRFAMIGLIAALGAYLTTGQIIPGFV